MLGLMVRSLPLVAMPTDAVSWFCEAVLILAARVWSVSCGSMVMVLVVPLARVMLNLSPACRALLSTR